jgi:hypothetical protein
MAGRIIRVLLAGSLVGCAPWVLQAQTKAPTGIKVTQITGLPGVKNKTGGRLLAEGSSLHFSHEQMKVDLPTNSMEDVITGNDSQRFIHGAPGLLLMAAPYGSGRFLSLFRTKMDTLTIKYRDTDGGLHGVIFTMPAGQAEVLKKDLVAKGAHTSAPPEDEASKIPTAKEPKQ